MAATCQTVVPCDCLTIICQHDESVTLVQGGCLCRVQVQAPILGDVAAQDPLTEQAPRVPAGRRACRTMHGETRPLIICDIR